MKVEAGEAGAGGYMDQPMRRKRPADAQVQTFQLRHAPQARQTIPCDPAPAHSPNPLAYKGSTGRVPHLKDC